MGKLYYNQFGNYGRLGNQMFQYAALVGISRQLNMSAFGNLSSSKIVHGFNLKLVSDAGDFSPDDRYTEAGFAFDPGVYQIDPNTSTELLGFFQSEMYFQNCKDEIRNEFSFKQEIKESLQLTLPADNLVSLHVRRTDYCEKKRFHTNLSQKYYRRGMQRFPNHRPVVFSDDIDWCRKEMIWLQNDPLFMENDSFSDLYLMSSCHAHIIANSSYSWWAAWLSGGNTIAPKKWFGPDGPQDFQDIYCDGWEIL